jgi:hypothetical protein
MAKAKGMAPRVSKKLPTVLPGSQDRVADRK